MTPTRRKTGTRRAAVFPALAVLIVVMVLAVTWFLMAGVLGREGTSFPTWLLGWANTP